MADRNDHPWWRGIEVPVWTVRVAIAALAAAISAMGLFSFSYGQGAAWGGRDPAGLTLTVLVGFALASVAAIRPSLGGDNRFKAFTALVIIGLTLKDINSFDALTRSLLGILAMLIVIAVTRYSVDRWQKRESRPKRPAAPTFANAVLLLVLLLPLVGLVVGVDPAFAQSDTTNTSSGESCPLLDDVAVLLNEQPIAFEGPTREISIDEGTEVAIQLEHTGASEHVTVHIALVKTRLLPLPFTLPELVYTGEVEPGSASETAVLGVERDGLLNMQEFTVVRDDERVASGSVRAFAGVGTFEITAIGASGERCTRTVDLRIMSEGWQTPDSLLSVGVALIGGGALAGLGVAGPVAPRGGQPKPKSGRKTNEPAPLTGPPPRINKIRTGSGSTTRTYGPDEPVPINGETRLEIEFKPVGENDDEVERHLEAGGVVRVSDAGLLIRRKFSTATSVSGAPMLVGFMSVDTKVADETTTMRLLVLDQEVLISRADKVEDIVIDTGHTSLADTVDLTDGQNTSGADR